MWLSGMWLHMDLRDSVLKNMCSKEIGLHAQNKVF